MRIAIITIGLILAAFIVTMMYACLVVSGNNRRD